MMSKLGCTCGETIRDQTDHIPYKGYLAADMTYFDAFDRAAADAAAFVDARASGTERGWLSAYFNADYPSVGPESVIHDIFTRHLFPEHREVFQCPSCRRLHVQQRDEPDSFSCFTPEEKSTTDVFA